MNGWFVTGTDTEIGKTRAAVALIRALRARDRSVAAMKPVAAGCDRVDGELRNADALDLIVACDRSLPYAAVNPYAFEPPIAPHIAARQAGVEIEIPRILRGKDLLVSGADALVVEGVGGWAVPLGEGQELRDLALALQLPVILAVGLRLGCLSHTLLSARQIVADGAHLAGWIGSVLDPDMACLGENIQTLRDRLDAPCLGVLPYDPTPDPDALGLCLDLDALNSG